MNDKLFLIRITHTNTNISLTKAVILLHFILVHFNISWYGKSKFSAYSTLHCHMIQKSF